MKPFWTLDKPYNPAEKTKTIDIQLERIANSLWWLVMQNTVIIAILLCK